MKSLNPDTIEALDESIRDESMIKVCEICKNIIDDGIYMLDDLQVCLFCFEKAKGD